MNVYYRKHARHNVWAKYKYRKLPEAICPIKLLLKKHFDALRALCAAGRNS